MNIRDTNIAAHFVTCLLCQHNWRTTNATRCPLCAQAYGVPFQLDPLRVSELMDAMRIFQDENEYKGEEDVMRLALTMEDNCPWFNDEDPWYSQACWMHLREFLRDEPPTPHVSRAMEIFEIQFRETIMNVDERGEYFMARG